MFEKDKISIDITSEKITILVGTRYKTTYSATIETPAGAYVKDEIINVEAIIEAIQGHIGKARFRTKSKEAYFIIRGDDLIVRHITLPQMKEAALKDSVEWELTQFVGERADEYTVSYEIVSTKGDEKDANLEILMVAVEKTKTEKYIALAKSLNLDLCGIDIPTNISARALRAYQNIFNKSIKSIGVIDLGADYSSLAIIERGKIQMEKYFSYGIANSSPIEISNNREYRAFLEKINLDSEEDFTNGRLQSYFDNITSQFNGIIQFYSSGKVKKTLDKIYIVGSAVQIPGLDKLLEDIFNTRIEFLPDFSELKFSVKLSDKIVLSDYIYNFGLILKNNKNELNLVPEKYNEVESGAKKQKVVILLVGTIVFILVAGFAGVQAKSIYLKLQKKSLTEEYDKSIKLIEKRDQLNNNIGLITQHIDKANKLQDQKTKDTDKLLIDLSSKFPSDVKTTNVTYNRNQIVISGTASSQESIEVLWANLRESDTFKSSYINSIANSNNSFSFSLEIKLMGGENNEQAS